MLSHFARWSARLAPAARRALPRQRYYGRILVGAGVFVSAPLLVGSVVFADSELPVLPKASDSIKLVATDGPESVVDAATGIEFPKVVKIGAKVPIPPLTLVGVGVRTVSFLGIKVYSVGFYADLRDPSLKFDAAMSPQERVEHIIQNTHTMLRIIPTRATSYSHLRDAFVRTLYARMAKAKAAGELDDEVAAMEISIQIGKLKTLFPNSPLGKNVPLDVFFPKPLPGKTRSLIFRDLGVIESDWVSREFMVNYFEDKVAPSPPLRKAVLDRLESVTA